MKRVLYIALSAVLVVACRNNQRGSDEQETVRHATGIPELPERIEGRHMPEIDSTYKIIADEDTCFVVVEQISDTGMSGFYYKVEKESDCVERRTFAHNIQKQFSHTEVYTYRPPHYTPDKNRRYRNEIYKIDTLKDVEYGESVGYWVSMITDADDSYADMVAQGLKKGLSRSPQKLTMDIYRPHDNSASHPFVMLLHGGGFYVGDKSDSAIVGWCSHFARMGYVAASINYRMGFLPFKREISRAGYMAVQDAHAAMRWMVDHASEYAIDTSLLFIGGASAGAITALNVAFMRDENRPSYVGGKRQRDLGSIASKGNDIDKTFHIKAVVNMWGAVTDLALLGNSRTDIISFHGDADQVVPYDHGLPFMDISKRIGKRLFDPMYGSLQIDKQARAVGLRSKLYTFPNEGHALHRNTDGSWNQHNFTLIQQRMTSFLYDEIIGKHISIEQCDDTPRHFRIEPSNVKDVAWKVEGGYIMQMNKGDIQVVWRNDSEQHILYATGHYLNGLPFEDTYVYDIEK